MIKCEDCRYWQHGECHRYAPKPVTPQGVAYGGFARWPLTNPEDWCGEAEPVGTELVAADGTYTEPEVVI